MEEIKYFVVKYYFVSLFVLLLSILLIFPLFFKKVQEIIKEIHEKHPLGVFIVWLFILLMVLIVLFFIFEWKDIIDSYSSNTLIHTPNEELTLWLYFLTGAGTVLLAGIAWVQFGPIKQNIKGEFLLRIDEQWGSNEAIKAKTIIHQIYIETQRKHPKVATAPLNLHSLMGIEIINLSCNIKHAEDFIYVLNFLDFMDTIGFLYIKEFVNADDLNALCGEALVFNYEIYQPYIIHKRDKHANPKFYENFEKLYKELNKKADSSNKKV